MGTENTVQYQLQELERELEELNTSFEDQLKQLNMTEDELDSLRNQPVPPEVQEMLEQAKSEAIHAGEARKKQNASSVKPSGLKRRSAMYMNKHI